MIAILHKGDYKLIETKHHVKVLFLDNNEYAWVEPVDIGEILVASHRVFVEDCLLAKGRYYLYDVKDENRLTDLQHLELEVGQNTWQGYLLLTGLPTGANKIRSRIIPTKEIITRNPLIRGRKDRSRISAVL